MGLRETEEVVEQVLQPLAFPLHQVDLFHRPAFAGGVGLAEVLGQQLHVHADRRKWILDLVRQPAGKPHDLGVLIDQPLVEVVVGGHKRNCSGQGRKHNPLRPRRG